VRSPVQAVFFRAYEEETRLFLRHAALLWNKRSFALSVVDLSEPLTGTIFFMHHAEH
jgi:hypothetical protein